jgi:CubicO group peptidase (beta-lactamase class C family)
MLRLVCLALVALVLFAGASAGEDPPRSPTDVLDDVFVPYDIEDGPGLAVAVVHKGRIIYERGFGLANIEQGTPITPETIFRIGSTSKQFTAACIALLALRGEVDLDADLRTWITELSPELPPVSLRQAVHHVSGLPDYTDFHVARGASVDDHITTEDTLELLSEVTELDFEPGQSWAYSNTNYLLMGEVVRRVSGQSLRAFAQENIFDPLGMTHTHFHDRHDELVVGRADGYIQQPGRLGQSPVWRKSNTGWDHVGDGGVFTTVGDLALWDANFADNQLEGGDELMLLMLTSGRLADGTEHGYAFGLRLETISGRQAVSHSGGWAGFTADMLRFPEQGLTVFVLSNGTAPVGQLSRRLAALLLR